MSGNAVRLQAIMDVEAYVPPAHSFDETEAPGEVFGRNVFTKSEMQKRLPKSVYKSVMATIERGHDRGRGLVGEARQGPSRPWTGRFCCSMYCRTMLSGAPPTDPAQ